MVEIRNKSISKPNPKEISQVWLDKGLMQVCEIKKISKLWIMSEDRKQCRLGSERRRDIDLSEDDNDLVQD